MLNRTVWNRTVYMFKNGFGIKQPTKIDMPKKKKTPTKQAIISGGLKKLFDRNLHRQLWYQ